MNSLRLECRKLSAIACTTRRRSRASEQQHDEKYRGDQRQAEVEFSEKSHITLQAKSN
jgi:hypothetical protein